MDYDQTAIAATYDAARGYRPEVLRQWLDLVAAHAPLSPQARSSTSAAARAASRSRWPTGSRPT